MNEAAPAPARGRRLTRVLFALSDLVAGLAAVGAALVAVLAPFARRLPEIGTAPVATLMAGSLLYGLLAVGAFAVSRRRMLGGASLLAIVAVLAAAVGMRPAWIVALAVLAFAALPLLRVWAELRQAERGR
ncbi:MAG: hypothetical protein QM601_13625 [Pseudoxanthomonas sp.]